MPELSKKVSWNVKNQSIKNINNVTLYLRLLKFYKTSVKITLLWSQTFSKAK